MTALLRVARNVANLEVAAMFYRHALGFRDAGAPSQDPALAKMLGLQSVKTRRMSSGDQKIELSECHPAGAPYPNPAAGNDLWFQHLALVTTDIHAACAQVLQAGATAITQGGPQQLPPESGGVTAFKFRDPEGHPLELLQFPPGHAGPSNGYDHSAISISNVQASIAFYTQLGLRRTAQQINQGPAQDRLDGLAAVIVDVVALSPTPATPHVELLRYQNPPGKTSNLRLNGIAADRLVFSAAPGTLSLLQDPDGHVVVLDGR